MSHSQFDTSILLPDELHLHFQKTCLAFASAVCHKLWLIPQCIDDNITCYLVHFLGYFNQSFSPPSSLQLGCVSLLVFKFYFLFQLGMKSKYSEQSWHAGDSQKRPQKEPGLSPAEQERQQILQEMRKKTSLHTDNSWIRQRSSSMHKEPVSLPGGKMRR